MSVFPPSYRSIYVLPVQNYGLRPERYECTSGHPGRSPADCLNLLSTASQRALIPLGTKHPSNRQATKLRGLKLNPPKVRKVLIRSSNSSLKGQNGSLQYRSAGRSASLKVFQVLLLHSRHLEARVEVRHLRTLPRAE